MGIENNILSHSSIQQYHNIAPYDESKLYDIILLLAGENTESYPRSSKAIEIHKKGKTGGIFITGGYGGFAPEKSGKTDGQKSLSRVMHEHFFGGNSAQFGKLVK